ncbi:MAG: tyrosine-protein phosphatase [Saprospiraceae bacterium]
MFSFFKKKEALVNNFSHLGLDMHAHLIPGIDDGADTIETALQLIRGLQELGYQQLYATPHVMSDLYPNTRGVILEGLERLKSAVQAAGITVEIGAAAEYYMDEHFENIIHNEEILTLPNNRVLVEMSFVTAPPNLFHYIFRLQTKGYKPILAHPERYLFLKSKFNEYHRLKEYGCEFQLNTLSLIGHYGRPVQEIAFKLLKNKMIDYIGTDLHHQRHIELLHEALKDRQTLEILTKYEFANAQLMEASVSAKH